MQTSIVIIIIDNYPLILGVTFLYYLKKIPITLLFLFGKKVVNSRIVH